MNNTVEDECRTENDVLKLSRYHHASTKGEREYRSSFLTSALDGVTGQRHAPAVLNPRKGPPIPVR
jgi:hypothetical protein